ncbi:MAG TPA: AraC family transcriptional regulator ligand-binding domain-containing protein [Polyangiaceae bacterium]|jgi:AraC-like DNA-binding protein|nr:AraC family transcriptional regulator ligand-binding domain-containing protein [Polyangiaceae bacterium]
MKEPFTHFDAVVPPQHPRALVEIAVGQGADRAAMLDGSGVTASMLADPDTRLTYMQFGLLTKRALEQTRNPALGLDFGRSMRPAQMGMLGLALMSSETVGAALSVSLRHHRILAPAWELSFAVIGERARLTARDVLSFGPFVEFATESLLMGFAALGSALCGKPLPIRSLKLPYAAPPYAHLYAEHTGVTPVFGASVAEAEFDAALLDVTIAGADPVTAALAAKYCDASAPVASGADDLVERARRLLAATEGPPPELERVAGMLRTTPRELGRSLRERETTYAVLVEDARRSRAEEWVRATAMTFEQIAYELGFGNVRSFRRAFKRWTGNTPGAARAAALGGDRAAP